MSEAAPDPDQQVAPDPAPETKDPLRGSRTSGAWIAVVVASVLLVLLIIFIAQNTDDVHVSFLGWDGEAPLSVTLLIAITAGVIVTALVGTLRIWQLRSRVKHERV